jgi:hypothetical protein
VPTLSELFFSPLKVLKVLFLGTAETAATTNPAVASAGAGATSQSGHTGALCYTQVSGDQTLNVCQMLGYEMPSFVLWASLLIFALFVITCLTMLFQCSQLSRVFNQLANQINKLPQGDSLPAIRGQMSKNALTIPAWRKFEESLIVSPQGDEVFTSTSIDDAFPRGVMIDENVHGAFFGTVPGILTGLGLLMTFIAILDGLSHVSVGANMDVQGIGGLINGLSGKFVSSIVAVTCAVSFVFVERIAYSQPQRAYRKLINALAARFKRKTTEHLLYQLQRDLMTQATLQRELAQTIAQITSPSGRGTEASHGRR